MHKFLIIFNFFHEKTKYKKILIKEKNKILEIFISSHNNS